MTGLSYCKDGFVKAKRCYRTLEKSCIIHIFHTRRSDNKIASLILVSVLKTTILTVALNRFNLPVIFKGLIHAGFCFSGVAMPCFEQQRIFRKRE
ncbi:MAG TPA: hypothetical protein DCG69_03155 [Bacteroidales bacterium]|nr:hypothetical protein [Bacteroidales bacterium]